MGDPQFGKKAFAVGTSMPGVVSGINAMAQNVYNNALQVSETDRVYTVTLNPEENRSWR